VGSILVGSGSDQAAGGNYQPSVMSSELFTLAEAVLQLAQSWLAVTLSKLLAPNCQPSGMAANFACWQKQYSILFCFGCQ
jgi:hypothetical protein